MKELVRSARTESRGVARWINRHPMVTGLVSFFSALAAMTAPSYAAGATYDITPVTTSLTTELTSNVPIILGVVGALIALAIAVRMVRKFVKA